MRNTYHDRHFARSCREAFGSEFHPEEHYEPDNWRWTWPLALFYAFVVLCFVGWRYADAAPRYEKVPPQQRVELEFHYLHGEMR